MSKELDCSFNIQTTDILLSHFFKQSNISWWYYVDSGKCFCKWSNQNFTVFVLGSVLFGHYTVLTVSLIIPLKWFFFVCLWQCLCYCCCCSTNQNSRSHDCYIQMFSWCLFLEIPPACCVSLVQCVIVSIIVVCVCVGISVEPHSVFYTIYKLLCIWFI